MVQLIASVLLLCVGILLTTAAVYQRGGDACEERWQTRPTTYVNGKDTVMTVRKLDDGFSVKVYEPRMVQFTMMNPDATYTTTVRPEVVPVPTKK